MWEARAEYADGTSVWQYFEADDRKSENEQQHEIECWLIERNKDCTWYSVNWVQEG